MPRSLKRPFIVLGGGGHAAVVMDLLDVSGCEVFGVADADLPVGPNGPYGAEVIGNDETVFALDVEKFFVAMGIGSTRVGALRNTIYRRFEEAGFMFPSLLHPGSIVSQRSVVGAGSQVMAGAVINARSSIGRNCIINTHASTDHDCVIGNDVHVASGAILSGGVKVGAGVHIGTGATIIQSVEVGAGSLIGAGVAVLGDVPAGMTLHATQTPVWNG